MLNSIKVAQNKQKSKYLFTNYVKYGKILKETQKYNKKGDKYVKK